MTEKEAQFKAFLDSLSEEKRMQLFEYLKKLSPEERSRAVDNILNKLQQVKTGNVSKTKNPNMQARPNAMPVQPMPQTQAQAKPIATPTQPKPQTQVKPRSQPMPVVAVSGQNNSRPQATNESGDRKVVNPSVAKAPVQVQHSEPDEEANNVEPRRGNSKKDIAIVVAVLIAFIVLCFGIKIVLDKYLDADIPVAETVSTHVSDQINISETTDGAANATVDETTAESAEPSPTPTPAPTLVPLKADAPDLTGMVIVIDPGHQATMWAEEESVAPGYSTTKKKATPGTIGVATGVKEYELTLDISLMLKEYLEQCGAVVVLTRTTNDVQLSNQERAQIAVDNNANLFIRIHADKANDSYTSGVKVFVTNKGDYSSSLVGWGNTLGQGVADSIGLGFIGTTSSDLYTGLNYASSIPSFQLSVGLLSNSDDEAVITNPDNQVNICDAIARFAIDFK